jgi:periplasmic protein TonB
MKTIKTKQSCVERNRSVYLQIGLVLALAVVLTAFEWKTYEKTKSILLGSAIVEIIEALPPVTTQPKPPPPPINIAEIMITIDELVDLPEVIIDVGVNTEKPEDIYIPPPLPDEQPVIDDTPRLFAEVMPEFPGGESAMRNFLRDHLRYPEPARSLGITGTVYISFVVERDGSITEIQILRGGDGGLSEEALRVARLMPKWKPGIQAGYAVRVKFHMPITFVLQ